MIALHAARDTMSIISNPWDQPACKPSSIAPDQGVRLFFGSVLVIFGLIVGGVLVYQIKQVVFGSQEPAMITRLSAAAADETTILINLGQQQQSQVPQKIQIPPKTLSVIAYLFTLIAMGLVGKLVYVTLAAGTRLLMAVQSVSKSGFVEPPRPLKQEINP